MLGQVGALKCGDEVSTQAEQIPGRKTVSRPSNSRFPQLNKPQSKGHDFETHYRQSLGIGSDINGRGPSLLHLVPIRKR